MKSNILKLIAVLCIGLIYSPQNKYKELSEKVTRAQKRKEQKKAKTIARLDAVHEKEVIKKAVPANWMVLRMKAVANAKVESKTEDRAKANYTKSSEVKLNSATAKYSTVSSNAIKINSAKVSAVSAKPNVVSKQKTSPLFSQKLLTYRPEHQATIIDIKGFLKDTYPHVSHAPIIKTLELLQKNKIPNGDYLLETDGSLTALVISRPFDLVNKVVVGIYPNVCHVFKGDIIVNKERRVTVKEQSNWLWLYEYKQTNK